MTRIDFWFDSLSPYAWMAFDRLPDLLEGLSVEVVYRPLVLGGLLAHWGTKGPAEVAPKRDWTYRQVLWLAQRQGTPLQLPQPHPFNSLALQRLALASVPAGGTPNRRTVELLFRHVWCRGSADPNEPEALAALVQAVGPVRSPQDDAVKAELRDATAQAAAAGIFGVPTLVHAGRAFFGQDALPMLRAALDGEAWFSGPEWDRAAQQPPGLARRS